MQSEEQLKEMLSNTKQYANYPVFLAVDEEGDSRPENSQFLGSELFFRPF